MKILARIRPPGKLPPLKDLQRNSGNLGPALNSIANMMESSVEQNFVEEGRPDPWTVLKEATIRARRRKNKWPGQILTVSGQLRSSINTRVSGNNVIIGSNKKYAKAMNEGNPEKNIPARPFLLFQDEDVKEAEDILIDHLLKGVK